MFHLKCTLKLNHHCDRSILFPPKNSNLSSLINNNFSNASFYLYNPTNSFYYLFYHSNRKRMIKKSRYCSTLEFIIVCLPPSTSKIMFLGALSSMLKKIISNLRIASIFSVIKKIFASRDLTFLGFGHRGKIQLFFLSRK